MDLVRLHTGLYDVRSLFVVWATGQWEILVNVLSCSDFRGVY